MAAKGGSSTRRTQVHVRDKEFTLFLRKRGLFTVLVPTGKYTETLLGALVQDFLAKPGYVAVDLSRLDAVTLTLIKALYEFAAGLDPARGRLVLVNPPDRIRGLVKLVGGEGKVTIIVSERELEGELGDVDERIRRSHDRLHLVRTMMGSHPCWQLVDGESRWLCPFCVTLRGDIRFIARGSPTQTVIDRVANHLSEECTTYTDGQTDGWPFEVLEQVLTGQAATAEAAREKAPLRARPDLSDTKVRRKAEVEEDDRRRRMLPRETPTIPGCEIAVAYRGAPVQSGDFFDFVRMPGGRVGILVGDVSSADVDAGVLMGVARKVLCIRLRETPDPEKALGLANDDLCEELDGESFVSAAVAIVDGAKRELRIARAGHAAPFLVHDGTVTRLELSGPVLGFVPTASFEQGFDVRSVPLNPGDLLLLHTDGLEDLEGRGGERFGADRVAGVLQEHAALDAALLLGTLMLEAEQFAGNASPEADLTAICLKVR